MKRNIACAASVPSASSSLLSLNGYVIHINNITKNASNDNHHYSFIICLEDQSTVRVVKYLGKIASCSLFNQLKQSFRTGNGASITCLREQNGQYACTVSTKIVEKHLDFRPECIRTANICTLQTAIDNHMCTVEAKICHLTDPIPIIVDQNEFKRTQKMKKNCHHRFLKIDDLCDVVEEVGHHGNLSKANKGQIVSVESINDEYKCQGCGGMNITETENLFSCNDCRCRLSKERNVEDFYVKLKIFTFTNEEYNLKATTDTISTFLNDIVQPKKK
ncbi:unnamed protein product [Adineta ricciae]|uniref:Uncharacterized protein n=1 Tax=Adineta ricciae TaxID=249248 RepID=A0A816DV69_ADIRI|nr:unnamed protein product [Adineta ricciae]CAF1643898.1 unnamed protein product [Adineta ricciae]